MLTTRCSNCGAAKDNDHYAIPHCKDCEKILNDIENKIKTDNITDPFVKDNMRQEGLLSRRQHFGIYSRPDSRAIFNPIDTNDISNREAITPGTVIDPRRVSVRGI